jgi:hypothetical protein
MRIVTRALLAASAAEQWLREYPAPLQVGDEARDAAHTAIYPALVALGPTPNPDAVDTVIGNNSWTATECEECHAHGVPVVRLGRFGVYKPEYQVASGICLTCLQTAVALLKAAQV